MADAQQKLQAVIARMWKDESFKQQVLADPRGTLAAAGIVFPDHVKVRVHVNTPDTVNIVVPVNPAESELLDETLSAVSGGSGDTCINTTCQSHCPGSMYC